MHWILSICLQIDLSGNRQVSTAEGRLWAESRGFLYYETSALTNDNVFEMFEVGLSINSNLVLHHNYVLLLEPGGKGCVSAVRYCVCQSAAR